jgi:hypothetical protein
MTRTHRRTSALVAAAGLCTLLVAGCSGGGGSHSSAEPAQQGGGGSAQAATSEQGRADLAGPESAGSSGSDDTGSSNRATSSDPAAKQAVDVAQADRKLIRTADLTIRVDKVKESVVRVHRILTAAQGYVVDEQVGGDDDLRTSPSRDFGGHATITLAVPAERLDAVLGQLADVGTVTERSTTSTDVTKDYVDTASRIATMQTSVDRLRRLMRDATDLDQITQLESALTTREATLESLKSQMSSLKTQVAMSTVTVTLSTTAVPVAPASTGPSGFVEGLSAGWHAFTSAVAAVVTVLGVLVPFVALALLVGTPVLVWLRRRRSATVSGGSTPAPAP